jgi:hypothetical protein
MRPPARHGLRPRGERADEGLVDISSLPPLLPQEMESILGDASGVQALTGGTSSTSPAAGAFLDLSPEQQVQMAQLEDDETLFGGSAGASSFDSIEPNPEPVSAYDPTQDVANPAYSEPAGPTDLWA